MRKINSRLPPIQTINEVTSTTDNDKNRIIKALANERNPFSSGIGNMSPPSEMLLLDTYPPRNWNVPYSNGSKQGFNRQIEPNSQGLYAHIDLPFLCNNPEIDFSELEIFPSPLSDRLPSSHRFYRPNVTSACSRRSSILFQRIDHSNEPKLQREDTFDTVCESVLESVPPLSHRRSSSYTVLPPITDEFPSLSSHPSSLLLQSFNDNEVESNRLRKSPRILKSSDSESKQNISSISPPLVTINSSQNKKDEFVRRILSRSLSREPSLLTRENDMIEPTTNTEPAYKEDSVTPQIQIKSAKSTKPVINKPSSTSKGMAQVKSTRSSELKLLTASKPVVTPVTQITKSKAPFKIPKPIDRLKPEIRDRVLNPEISAHLETETRSRRNSSCPVLAKSVDVVLPSQEKLNDGILVVAQSTPNEKNLSPLTKVRRTTSQRTPTTTTRNGKFILDVFQPQSKTKTTIDPLVVQKSVFQKSKNVTNCTPQETQQNKIIQTTIEKNSSENVENTSQVITTESTTSSVPPTPLLPLVKSDAGMTLPVEAPPEQNTVHTHSIIDMIPIDTINVDDLDRSSAKETESKPAPKTHQQAFQSGRIYPRKTGPVPKPLTLQGEKNVDPDYPCSSRVTSTVANGQRRGSFTSVILNSQPHITDLFENFETNNAINNLADPLKVTKQIVTVKKQRQKKITKNTTKTIKNVQKIPAKTSKKPAKNQLEKQVVAVYADMDHDELKQNKQDLIVVGGNNWVISMKPKQLADQSENEDDEIEEDEVVASGEDENIPKPFSLSSKEIPTVDDEDLSSIYSYDNQTQASSSTDRFAISHTTIQTTDETYKYEIPDQTNINSMSMQMMNTAASQTRSSTECVQSIGCGPVIKEILEKMPNEIHNSIRKTSPTELINSQIRVIYENVQDSVRKETSLRSLPKMMPSNVDIPNEHKTDNIQSEILQNNHVKNATLLSEASLSYTRTTNSEQSLSIRPGIRVVGDSLNSRGGSETMSSTSSHEDHDYGAPLLQDSDTDEIYRSAKKGKTVGHGAYGTVWSYLMLTGRMIAVKEIELDEGESVRVREDYEAVREEVNILRALDHPYIVKFLGISLENTRLVKIFMSYLKNSGQKGLTEPDLCLYF
ncbi:unnamed protein product [Didymodactylos carnosus]|uniref:Protein kinase domain-containing protein n=1 Tax=Didymodactylos carnosus TaxID=1234261 RepID=A0A8S2PCC5_9BILA|nr:unnamed protein product [Didymodactylos carnosus]CAF4045675.1 unnamed protein product [Didymodactylos carnosus]